MWEERKGEKSWVLRGWGLAGCDILPELAMRGRIWPCKMLRLWLWLCELEGILDHLCG
jgi:hypothetical protein